MERPRIEELRRRVEQDPASIAFAQLAEEYRRAGQPAEALRVCRAGLAKHPGYLSARVTLGRALIDLGEYAAAETELDDVLRAAPDNLVAIRARADLHQRRELSPDPVASLVPVAPVASKPAPALPDFDAVFRATDEQFARALEALSDAVAAGAPDPDRPALQALEQWLAAIERSRAVRRAGAARP